ncbi:MAG: hypothetical protein FJ280_08715 [Planctomycetes bacterium]|nr:hypothetical protein [Planctomycetota bacterium]
MGPAIVPAVLDAIADEPDTHGAWIFLWGLTKLAARSEDEALRGRVIRACIDLLEKVERGEADPGEGMNAAWTLALFQHPEHEALLQRLVEKPMARWWSADYRGALELLQGHPEHALPPELWEQPVEEWLTSRCRMVEKAAAEAAQPTPPPEEDPDERFARTLANDFIRSPVAVGLPRELLQDASTIVYYLARLSREHLRTHPRDWNEAVLHDLLLVLVPHEAPLDREQLEKTAPITQAFLYWLQTQNILAETDALMAKVRQWSDRIVVQGSDRRNWGSRKTLVMETAEAGPEAIIEKMIELLTRQADAAMEGPPGRPKPAWREPAIPIGEHSAKPARNAPCPCGSGRKYKKRHGRPEAEQTTSR